MNKEETKNIKEKIIESLEGKRAKQIWELIEKSYLEIYKNTKKSDLELAKEEYADYEDNINDKNNRYLVVEHYILNDGFYCRYYRKDKGLQNQFGTMFEDYFTDDIEKYGGSWEQILIIDMEDKKCYLVDKEIKYPKVEVKIK